MDGLVGGRGQPSPRCDGPSCWTLPRNVPNTCSLDEIMGGDATFAGTTFQARVIAYIYTHLLAQSPLGWLAPRDDTPLAVLGETDGPGDDARVEFRSPCPAIEVQAKHGLTAGARLQEVFQRVTDRAAKGDCTEVVLAVDRGGSSRKVYGAFAADLERMRGGRTDGLNQDTRAILAAFDANGYDRAFLYRVRIVGMDLDRESDPDAKLALQLLRSHLENPGQVAAAWAVLITDAGDICARRLRRTRKDLVDLLAIAGIRLRPRAQDAAGHADRSPSDGVQVDVSGARSVGVAGGVHGGVIHTGDVIVDANRPENP